MKTGNTADIIRPGGPARIASMEPGHEDREYQQTPVECETHREASMEPGHEDREYLDMLAGLRELEDASMEPGHEDREY